MFPFDKKAFAALQNGGAIAMNLELPAGPQYNQKSQELPSAAWAAEGSVPVIYGMNGSSNENLLPSLRELNAEMACLRQNTAEIQAIVNYAQVTKKMDLLRHGLEREEEISNIAQGIQWKQPVLPLVSGLEEHCDLDAVPRSLVKCAEAFSGQTGMSFACSMLGLIVCLSMATQGRNRVDVGEWKEACVDFGIISSQSGNRKTNAAESFKRPFDIFLSELMHTYVNEHSANNNEAKIINTAVQYAKNDVARRLGKEISKNMHDLEAIKESVKKYRPSIDNIESLKINIIKNPQIFFDKASRAQLLYKAQDMAGCVCILRDEAGTLLGVLSRDPDMDFALNAHTMTQISYSTASHGDVNIPDPAMPMLHLIQHTKLLKFQEKVDPHGDGGNGLLPRFIIAFDTECSSSYQMAHAGNYEMYNKIYENKIISLLKTYYTQNINKTIYDIAMKIDAIRLCKEFIIENHQLIKSGKYSSMESFLNKSHGQAIRFAWDIHAWNHERPHEHPITFQEVLGGIQLMKLYIQHAEFFYVSKKIQAYNYAKEILSKILNSELPDWKKRFDSRFVQQQINGLKKSQELTLASLKILAQHDIIGISERSGKSAICVVNNSIFKLR